MFLPVMGPGRRDAGPATLLQQHSEKTKTVLGNCSRRCPTSSVPGVVPSGPNQVHLLRLWLVFLVSLGTATGTSLCRSFDDQSALEPAAGLEAEQFVERQLTDELVHSRLPVFAG